MTPSRRKVRNNARRGVDNTVMNIRTAAASMIPGACISSAVQPPADIEFRPHLSPLNSSLWKVEITNPRRIPVFATLRTEDGRAFIRDKAVAPGKKVAFEVPDGKDGIPRYANFTLELRDVTGQVIASECGFADGYRATWRR